MGERKAPRLAAFGEYDWRGAEESHEVHRARLELMRTAARVFPQLLETLSRDVFPPFDQAAQQAKLARPGYDFERALWAEDPGWKLGEALPEKSRLKSALSRWAKEFHVTADWLLVGAFRTLRLWRVAPDLRQALQWDTGHAESGPVVGGGAFEFSFIGWEPRLQTWAQYSQAVRESFERRLSGYEKETREMTEALGLVPARRQYSAVNLEWFVLYQFAGLSSKAIADRSARAGHSTSESAVLKGIKRAAELTGWGPLRSGQKAKGRRRKLEVRISRNRKTG
jgi:hypothetical protein